MSEAKKYDRSYKEQSVKQNIENYQVAALEWAFGIFLSDAWSISSGSYALPDGSVQSGTAYPINPTITDKNGASVKVKMFHNDYLKTYFDIFAKGYNDSSFANISAKYGVSGRSINTKEILALTSPNYPFGGYSFDGFKEYFNTRYCRYLRENGSDYADSGYEDKKESDYVYPVRISGKDLKNIAADYNSRYMPMANEDQYFYHYQGDNMTHSDSSSWYFTPYCPVYLFEKQWGNKGWTDFYFLPFANDDNVGSFYGQQYGHIYAKNVDGTVTMYFDLINMTDGSNYYSTSFVYDASTYKWIGLTFNGDLYDIYGFSSSYNYWNTLLVGGQYKQYGPFVQALYLRSTNNESAALKWTIMASTFTPKTNKNDDWGYILSNKPFELFANQTKIDFDRVPNNYIITINGDTIYDYSITNPDTGDTTDIKDYIDHDYDIPDLPDIKDPDDNSGTSGNVEVSGKIDVSGKVDVDVNVNVNSGSNGDSGSNGNAGDYIDPGTVDTNLDNYLEQVPELSKGFVDYLKDFFAWLPDQIYGLIILGLVVVVWCRLAGR